MTKRSGVQDATILWFRRDLRLTDNEAVARAAALGGAVVPVFILEGDHGPVRAPGAASYWWLDKSLQALAEDLAGRGSRLLIRRGVPADVLLGLAGEVKAGHVVWSRTFEPLADRRDDDLVAKLKEGGVEAEACGGKLMLDPASVCTQSGHLYSVFTPFWRAAEPKIGQEPPLSAPKALPAPARWPRSDTLASLGLHPSKPDWSKGFADWRPGEAGAQAQLERFLHDKLADYPHDRDRPALDGSSRLSPHLAWGELSPRQVYCAARARAATAGLEAQAAKFLTELGWREFDYSNLAQQPELSRKPFKHGLPGLKWRRSASDLDAWKNGRTGYPIVDAGMRQLWRSGWMHNRVRLITSSFLVKHLLIDWREGESWFWDCLVDCDPANNPANWQWIAGTGADAQPFFRIFNPVTQGEKFDPEGDYVRQWAPELAKADRRWIHQPWKASKEELEAAGIRLGDTYPKPIVAHEVARARALEALRAVREAANA
jgi:deoxyribodipyrimidine photo-lyase